MENMDELFVKYREVLLNQNTNAKYRTISINTGGIQNVLQDIKVSKTAGGFSYRTNQTILQNRFIYWRTAHDVLQISELSLNYNLRNNNVQINFEESPILSVEIFENNSKGIVILISTITSVHRIVLNHLKCNVLNDGTCDSILSSLSRDTMTDPRSFHIIGNEIGNNLPNAASSYAITQPEIVAFFAITSASNLFLFQIHENGGIKVNELKYNQIIPRFLIGITDALRRKNINDTDNISSITFGLIENQVVLYALYRDNTLRIWSTSAQCLATEYCSKYSECKASGSQNNIVRESNSFVCLFLSFSENSEFILFRTVTDESGNISLQRELVILSPQYDLIDYKITSNSIWALWCTSQGEVKVLLYKFNENTQQYWYPVALESMTEKKLIALESGVDPRHTFCSQIFYPGRFQHETILKAFLMFNRSFSYSDNSLSTTALKRHVCMAIDSEIQNEKKQCNLSDEEYVDLSAKVWEKFYHCCEQYHIAASQPIGLLILPDIDHVCIIKNKQISLLRPCDQIEISFLSGNYYTTNSPCQKLASDMKNLISILKSIDESLSFDCKADIDKKMYQLIPPSDIISADISLQDVMKDSNILPKIQMIIDLPKVINILLIALKFDDIIDSSEHLFDEFTQNSGYCFGSFIGIQLITETTKQIIHLRYILCRNLLILEHILIQNFVLNCNATEILRSKCLPDTVIFLQSYYVMVWISESVVDYNAIKVQSRPSISLGSIMRQDEGLNIEYITLLQFFIASKGLKYTVQRVNLLENFWTSLSVSTILSKLIWSISGDFVFGEWLYDNNLFLFIEEYVRLLNYWCEYHNYSRHFILGWSYLNNGEFFKALDVFLETANGVNIEPFLIKFVGILQDGSIQQEDILSTFYLKVIRLFEQQNAFDCVNIIGQIALGATDFNAQKAMFQSICFNSYMALGHFEEAYHSLISNCDPTRRKDCLRQLVWCLFDSKRFDILMEFPYIGLESDFQNIIETKARSVEIIDNDQYDFLYSFYIIKGNMRKASSIMYEKAYRCHLECNSISYLKIRYNSLLCSNNALNLVDKDYAWITRPSIKNQNEAPTNKTKIEVLTLQDIKKELLVCEALLNIAELSSDLKSILDMGPTELISLLTNERLYTAAMKLAYGCDMKRTVIYESLTYAFIQSCSADFTDTWNWLNRNNLLDITTTTNASETVILLLRNFLDNEIDEKDLCYQAIVNQLLINKAFVPQWLSDWFKINQPTEYLKLLVKYGRLEEAFQLTKNYFSENLLMNKKSEQIIIPISSIDVLLYEMKSIEIYQEQAADLEELLHYSFNKIII